MSNCLKRLPRGYYSFFGLRLLRSLFGLLVCALSVCVLSACGPLLGGTASEKEFFVIVDNQETPKVDVKLDSLNLLIRDTRANRFINSHKIIFSDAPGTRGFYQFAQWVEPPPDRIALMLTERFERSDAFRSATRIASSSLGDYQLNTEILEFYHDTAEDPGVVSVTLNAEIVDLADRKNVQQKKFSINVAVETYDAEGAARAFSIGVNKLLDEIVSWSVSEIASRVGD